MQSPCTGFNAVKGPVDFLEHEKVCISSVSLQPIELTNCFGYHITNTPENSRVNVSSVLPIRDCCAKVTGGDVCLLRRCSRLTSNESEVPRAQRLDVHACEAVEEGFGQATAVAALLDRVLCSKDAEAGRAGEGLG